ncbi:hypothetical protein ABL78_3871 [Leptomonas seymouri]|uniref:Uncharacterized protein n=1 Tax=Leptomonas seymouri TaxID=5684 RepID=A0A0N0P603_LEPSE|nr:hypothetical protein ABL78_3871 [Leptomonas seymouri]|eukprot:KPI87059.1 hypothetical protein ABL78_3871 [Leptomonas seymouri]
MDITKYNHLLALADFAKEIKRCDFCAVDQEMTGVDIPGVTPPLGASPEDVYHAKRMAVEAYNAFQMGIALFTKIDDSSYEVRPYNFYLLNSTGDLRLGLPAITFLAANHMNFQLWLTSGIAFCNQNEEQAFEERQQIVFADDSEQRIANECATAADDLLSACDGTWVKELSCTTDLAKRLKRFVERRSDYRLSVVYEGKPYIAQKIKLTLRKLSDTEWAAEKEKVSLQLERQRAEALGFRQFWKVLVDSKKPIVGHNFMQDVMFMFHMHQEPLPKSYAQFKHQLQKYLPEIYDTKTIAGKISGNAVFQTTHLSAVYQECRRRAELTPDAFSRKFKLPPGFYSYNDQAVKTQNKAHEAAYDAYMTGVVFCIFREMYANCTAEAKNIVSAFGSVYYMCIDEADKLVNNCTFVVKCDIPCSVEDIESLLYLTEESDTVGDDSGKTNTGKLPYMVNEITSYKETSLFTSFCVRWKTSISLEQFQERIKSLCEKSLISDKNVNLELLPRITVCELIYS